MKDLFRILCLTVLIIFYAPMAFSQTVIIPADTIKTVQKKTESTEQTRDNRRAGDKQGNQSAQGNQGNTRNAEGPGSIKKVNSARPDMSKARGARPNIVRPSGSGIPKGAGKPGGVGKIKGR